MQHKSGFVNIIGNPNVGKSTLMNQLVGERLSIITSKAQTTRHRILGIVNGDDFQIVYSDTPGIIKPNYKLQESMMGFVKMAMEDADVVIYVTDVVETFDKHNEYIERLKKLDAPILVVINKIDIGPRDKTDELAIKLHQALPDSYIIPVSALKGKNIDQLFNAIIEKLPEGAPYYPKDSLTDKPEKFFVSEIIREKILINYQKEIPYSTEVEIESFKEEEKIIRISALIYVIRDSQKGIIIGHKGSALKKVASQARVDIEKFLQKKVFLEVFVKVKKDWRNNDRQLKNFGYSHS